MKHLYHDEFLESTRGAARATVRRQQARGTVQRGDARSGAGLANEIASRPPSGNAAHRAEAACRILNHELGASTALYKEEGQLVIRGSGCPLSALTGKHRGVCLSIEAMLASLLEVPVRECCDRDERPRGCFRISAGSGRPSRARS